MHFNPRSPCGERHRPGPNEGHDLEISIHAPRVGSDVVGVSVGVIRHPISIHAPRVGSDGTTRLSLDVLAEISIHAPRVGSDMR